MAGKADAWRQQTSSSTTCTLSCRYGTRQAKKSLTACGPFHTVRITPRRASRRDLTWCTDATQPADDTDLIMLCYSVESKDSLENVESKWVGEIADNCPGVKLVLVALKCDLREQGGEDDDANADAGGEGSNPAAADGQPREKGPTINYDQGLEVARRIGASRYLECSAMKNRGVNEAFTEAARVALSVKKEREDNKCTVM